MVRLTYRDFLKLKEGQFIYIEAYSIDPPLQKTIFHMKFVGTREHKKAKYKKIFMFYAYNFDRVVEWDITSICQPAHVQGSYKRVHTIFDVYKVTKNDEPWFVADILTM